MSNEHWPTLQWMLWRLDIRAWELGDSMLVIQRQDGKHEAWSTDESQRLGNTTFSELWHGCRKYYVVSRDDQAAVALLTAGRKQESVREVKALTAVKYG